MNMKIKTIIVCGFAVALTVMAQGALADDFKAVGSGPNPFSDYGIGAALFPTSDVGATVSNVNWDVGTTAVASASEAYQESNRIVVISSPYCKYCIQLLDWLSTQEFKDEVKVINTGTDEAETLMRRFEVRGIPTTLHLRNNRLQGMVSGTPKSQQLIEDYYADENR